MCGAEKNQPCTSFDGTKLSEVCDGRNITLETLAHLLGGQGGGENIGIIKKLKEFIDH